MSNFRKLAEEGRQLVLNDPAALEIVSSAVRTQTNGDVFVEVNGKRYRVITSTITKENGPVELADTKITMIVET
jgi:hypothetical protein